MARRETFQPAVYIVANYKRGTMEHAIVREKQLKAGFRAKKLALIENENPEWVDLYESILG